MNEQEPPERVKFLGPWRSARVKHCVKQVVPPIVLDTGKFLCRYLAERRLRTGGDCTPVRPIERACHYHELFVRSSGDVYPCCLVWHSAHLRIGHISDPDLLQKIKSFHGRCSCERYKLVPGIGRNESYDLLNIELSYKCQAQCAMCCVDAPSFRGTYDKGNFDLLDGLISALRPRRILVQGGEILAQPDSMGWLTRLRQSMPSLAIEMVTNGNSVRQVGYVTNTFNRITVSFVGFQPATYRIIMGMDVEMTKRFCVDVIASGRTRVYLKYLITANNMHELPMFLEWAIGLAPEIIYFTDAGTKHYINENTNDQYWAKMISRTRQAVTDVILKHREFLEAQLGGRFMYIGVDGMHTAELLGLTERYIADHGLAKVVTMMKN